MSLDFDEIREMAKKVDNILSPEEREAMKMDPPDDAALFGRVKKQLMESNLTVSTNFTPLIKMVDKKTVFPWHGKESDAEIAFNFESVMDAQQLYDFVVNTGLLEPGEIKMNIAEHQVSVHFMSHVLVSKPEVFQAALLAYENFLEDDEDNYDAYESLVQKVDAILTERDKASEVVKKCVEGCGPVNVGYTKRPGAKKKKKEENAARRWDDNKEEGVKEGVALAKVLEKQILMQEITDDDLRDMIEALECVEKRTQSMIEASQDRPKFVIKMNDGKTYDGWYVFGSGGAWSDKASKLIKHLEKIKKTGDSDWIYIPKPYQIKILDDDMYTGKAAYNDQKHMKFIDVREIKSIKEK